MFLIFTTGTYNDKIGCLPLTFFTDVDKMFIFFKDNGVADIVNHWILDGTDSDVR